VRPVFAGEQLAGRRETRGERAVSELSATLAAAYADGRAAYGRAS